MAVWCDLPEGLVEQILDCLEYHAPEIVRCQAVCTSWRSAAKFVLNKRRRSIPWLLIPNQKDVCTRTLLNIQTQQTRTIHLPELHDRWICGSTNGWLVTIGLSRPYAMHLINPHSGEQVSLPPRATFLHPQLDGEDELDTHIPSFVRSAIVSTAPSDPNCVVLVIYGNSCHLALCRPGDDTWTHVENPAGEMCNHNLVFYKATGRFYIADNFANVKRLWMGSASASPRAVRIATPIEIHVEQKYLVESVVSGDFWLVLRNFRWDGMEYHTVSFDVFRMDLVTEEMSRVNSLGDESLFLGHNGSISVTVDGGGWCRPNCIYFLDDYAAAYANNASGCHDTGVFDLATMRVETEELAVMRVENEELCSRFSSTPFYWI